MIEMRSAQKRMAARVIDTTLGVLAPLFVRTQGSMPRSSPKVLVVRCDHIGDAAMATSVLRSLHDALRPSSLDVLASPWGAPVFRRHPLVTRVIEYATPWWLAARGAGVAEQASAWAKLPTQVRQLRSAQYDIGIDLRGDLRQITFFLALGGMKVRVSSDRTGGRRLLTHVWHYDDSLHEVEKNAAVAAQLGAHTAPQLECEPLRVLSSALESELSRAVFPNGYVVLALRGSATRRSWPAERAIEVVRWLATTHGIASVVVGGDADRAFGDAIVATAPSMSVNLAGRVSLDESMTVLSRARAAICVDSGPMHLAVATGCPVVGLFGPSDPARFRPWSENARVVRSPLTCTCASATCAFSTSAGRCMQHIDVGRVTAALEELVPLNGPPCP